MLAVVHEEPASIMHVLSTTAPAAPTTMHSLLRTPHRHLRIALRAQHVQLWVRARDQCAYLPPALATLLPSAQFLRGRD